MNTKRILVVDDEPGVTRNLKLNLESDGGYEVLGENQATNQSSPGSSRPSKRILLVDDDPTVRDSLNDVLVAESYFVIPAENGLQALDLANKSSVDLVLLDLNMPVKNGWDTFEQLTREHPLIPIIIATARPNQLFTAVNAGVGALLEKPMDIPTLFANDGKTSA